MSIDNFLQRERTFVIAEAGVNHNGNLATAHQLIDAAADAGADAVKFQSFKAEGVTLPGVSLPLRMLLRVGNLTMLEMLREAEMPNDWIPELMAHCKERGILFLSTPHDWESVEVLENHGIALYKIGSGDLTNIPFLKYVASKNKSVLLSTGMGTLEEVNEARGTLVSSTTRPTPPPVLLHCVSSYPAKVEEYNLLAIKDLQYHFGNPVGLSDHTLGDLAPIIAVSLGADVIEKHLTLDRNMEGPDHHMSTEPGEFKAMVAKIRLVEQAKGYAVKMPTPSEDVMKTFVRKSIVSVVDIPAGAAIQPHMISTKRPGTGIQPREWCNIVGRIARTDIPRDTLLHWDQVMMIG